MALEPSVQEYFRAIKKQQVTTDYHLDLATDEELEIEDQDTDESDERLPASLSDITTDSPPTLSTTILPVVSKVRKNVSKFRKSPVKNDILQKVVKQKHGKELSQRGS
ncbi:hypothetical protein ACHWQZ_G007454 [Mnemiopsis leidyi]